MVGRLGRQVVAAARSMSTAMEETGADLLTLEEVMQILKCKRTKLYSLNKEGRLHFVKFGHAVRVTRESVNQLLREIKTGRRDADA